LNLLPHVKRNAAYWRLAETQPAAASFFDLWLFGKREPSMITVATPTENILAKWRRQIGARRHPQLIAARTGFVSATFISESRTASQLVRLDRVRVALLFEDGNAYDDDGKSARSKLRFALYGASRIPHGVQWGGAENNRLLKDLVLMPSRDARGLRIGREQKDLLSLALRLDRRLSCAARHPAAPRLPFRLPSLWAGFYPSDALSVTPDGPEFEEACRRNNASTAEMLASAARREFGLVLCPLEWLSNQLECAAGVFVELKPSVCRQTFRVECLPDDLVGCEGAAAFDFFSSRFRGNSHNISSVKHVHPKARRSTTTFKSLSLLQAAASAV
jgi:hypothetical protein